MAEAVLKISGIFFFNPGSWEWNLIYGWNACNRFAKQDVLFGHPVFPLKTESHLSLNWSLKASFLFKEKILDFKEKIMDLKE